jgi:hypothetical protein
VNLIEALRATADPEGADEETSVAKTTYWLDGRIIFPDEVYDAQGFLPLLGRMAERKLMRTIGATSAQCGFTYLPDRDGLFGERFGAAMSGNEEILQDNLRLAALCAAAEEVLGMGYPGALDITPVYNFFMGMTRDARNALLQVEELKLWPLYQPLPVNA